MAHYPKIEIKAGSFSWNSFNESQSFVESQCDQMFLSNDHKNGPNNPPTNFIQLKFRPNHWAISSLKKNCPMPKTFAIGQFLP
jgi:hypothetical protein